jgi:hypothetical protein
MLRATMRRTLASLWLLIGCAGRPTEPPPDQRINVTQPGEAVTFAVIGDFGEAGQPASDVAALVHSWAPEFITTVGDNNYMDGSAATIDENIGQYYHDFIAPYAGKFGTGATQNRFFPSLGNHDWRATDLRPHLDYFALPGNERYYSVSWGPVDLFVVDSDPHEPDGVHSDSTQAQWLKAELAAADGPWKIVVMHHPPYSSGSHGSEPDMQWPYEEWGATAVLAGHDHHYERIEKGGLLYFINGLGGFHERYPVKSVLEDSKLRFNDDWGAMRISADDQGIRFEFITRKGELIDEAIRKAPD